MIYCARKDEMSSDILPSNGSTDVLSMKGQCEKAEKTNNRDKTARKNVQKEAIQWRILNNQL